MMPIVRMLLLGLFAFFLIPHFAGAASLPTATLFNCNSLFTNGATSPGYTPLVNTALSDASTYKVFLELSLFIVFMVLSVLGIVYAIGVAFNIQKLVTFVKNEYLESFANLLIVFIFVGGLGIFDGSVVFLAHLANTLLPAPPTSTFTSSQGVFIATCTNLENGMITTNLLDYGYVFTNLFIFNALVSFSVQLMPNDFGISFSPWGGIQTLKTALWSEEGISFGLLGMGGLLVMFLFVIYFLFPVFFYVGIVLRSFPWTRAAGGAMLALFISFYVVFPALVYPFSGQLTGTVNYICSASQVGWIGPGYYDFTSGSSTVKVYAGTQAAYKTDVSTYGGGGVYIGSSATSSPTVCSSVDSITQKLGNQAWSTLSGILDVVDISGFGSAMYDNVSTFTSDISGSIIEIVGIVIAFIISFDLLEALGGLLGSPSLRSNRLLSKVI